MTTISTKERPILFSGEMVRAILASKKTQTRRVMKPQPPCSHLEGPLLYEPTVVVRGVEEPGEAIFGVHDGYGEWGLRCPYGKPGDRLWVRERFYIDDVHYLEGPLPKKGEVELDQVYYHADAKGSEPACCQIIPECCCGEVGKPKWRPSIHMPRWASRILLEITDVRALRVKDITDPDAFAEGIESAYQPEGDGTARGSFAKLWDSINLAGGNGWASNPWVWVVEFKPLETMQ